MWLWPLITHHGLRQARVSDAGTIVGLTSNLHHACRFLMNKCGHLFDLSFNTESVLSMEL